MLTAKEELMEFLRDKEFRGYFTVDQIYELLALQIRQLREKHDWTQAELGEKAGMLQEAISRAENPDYRGTRITTVGKLASAFDVALIVRLAPFSELADWVGKMSETSFEPLSYVEEVEAQRTAYAPSPNVAFAVTAAEPSWQPVYTFGTTLAGVTVGLPSTSSEGPVENAAGVARKEKSHALAA